MTRTEVASRCLSAQGALRAAERIILNRGIATAASLTRQYLNNAREMAWLLDLDCLSSAASSARSQAADAALNAIVHLGHADEWPTVDCIRIAEAHLEWIINEAMREVAEMARS